MAELMAKVFKGMNIFMSRNLVPPELFDSLHDALKLNGAQVFLCCDPSRNGSNDYHVISSPEHEKFEDLRSKGCNLLGPQCVLSCAKEHRPLPKQGFTCCLAMDGVKLLASGFETNEKAEIGKLVTAMGGVLQIKASTDVNFVIAKNVLAARYKWALNILKKPIVTINWLHQCWKEHRVVPQESFRLLPFSGLTICVSRIPADQRKEMEKLVTQNGGKYSAELTKKCTHLVCDAPQGDKYKVAKRWGHIHIVSRKWFDQSVARRACLNEESYPVQGSSASLSTERNRTMLSQDKSLQTSQSVLSHDGRDPEPGSAWYAQTTLPDQDAAVSHNMFSTLCNATASMKEDGEPLVSQPKVDSALDGCVANDSQTEDNDLYLSDCKILLAGFDTSDMRKLVNMVRRGGGSRYMCLSEKLTHIVVGTPSDIETKQIRNLAALGIIYVVKTEWLEDCNHEKKEVPVLRRHIAYDLLLPKDPIYSSKKWMMDAKCLNEGKSYLQPMLPDDHKPRSKSGCGTLLEKRNETEVTMNSEISLGKDGNLVKQHQPCALDVKGDIKTQKSSSCEIEKKSLTVFEGKLFCFSCSFPENQRAEIVEWVNQGGGIFIENEVEANVQFIVESHGVVPSETGFSVSKYVSSHWIRSCLMDGCLLDVTSHILYSPLPCQVPFSGFKSFRFCVSQYDEKERLLLRNLCFILGVKFVEKLTKKVTHLLCKFSSGPKYEAACKWGIQAVTSQWIYECVKQNKVVSTGPFCPKEVTAQDQETGACTTTQYPTQACRIMSRDGASQLPSQSQEFNDTFTRTIAAKLDPKHSNGCHNRAWTLDTDNMQYLSSQLSPTKSLCRISPTERNGTENAREASSALPDVAAAIEDLLEQTSKIHDQKSPDRSRCEKSILIQEKLFTSDCTILGQDHREPQSALALPKHWMNRFDRKDDICKPSGDATTSIYDNFSETQTESQVVSYAEDLSGRQMIIDRVRTKSSMI